MNARVDLPPAREVCPTTTRRLMAEGALLVDVRELAEVAQVAFDVPGVLLMPLSEFEQRYAELPRDKELVLACQSGERSLKATYFLMYQGYTGVSNMSGGMLKWARKGFPITGTQPTPSESAGCCCGSDASAKSEPPAKTGCCGSGADGARSGGCC